jgi:hypothetical protein
MDLPPFIKQIMLTVGAWRRHRIGGGENMSQVSVTEIALTMLIGVTVGFGSHAYAQVPEALQHDRAAAEKLFERKCTECHSLDTALSSRAYRDWRLGIAQRHGKGPGWISDEDARLIFLHLIIHLEPQLETAVPAERGEPKENWKILICLISGFSTLALLIATMILGHSKTLRRKWFKGHSYFAIASLVAAVIHGGYCFYMFVLG